MWITYINIHKQNFLFLLLLTYFYIQLIVIVINFKLIFFSATPFYPLLNSSSNNGEFNRYFPSCLHYGIYSRYTPLSDILQFTKDWNLNSNCFHFQSIKDNVHNNIDSLSYDCIYYEKKLIEKQYTITKDLVWVYKQSQNQIYLKMNHIGTFWIEYISRMYRLFSILKNLFQENKQNLRFLFIF
ncbi:unnamed protein product [Paramecium octaurelia]|uniref:Transmembrane protein n=1 Tax=Paramecium octaurelia TaxID=43137 RepID=A0A8S1T2B0_PAROT|nr:unnamed protein product [Paramecium octaurelia]